jgi:predicted metalloprotease with PDZ domain
MSSRTLFVWAFLATANTANAKMAFTVSMPQPANHTYHVTFRCDGLKGELHDFKMPQWSPGYYGIRDYASSVSNFRAEDASGHALGWEKVARNTWRVVAANASTVVLNYDVFGNTAFAANSYLGDDRAYISPAGMFVHLAGQLQQPVTVEIRLPGKWAGIATGLDPVNGAPNTFEAADFDVLYDCPILIGNQERFQFEVRGVPHLVAIENVPASVERPRMIADLKSMVTAATRLIGDVPYKHYTFLMMGRGAGGIEHANSSSNQFDGNSLTTPPGYLRWLSFICHEYFHNFNVKRIRPLALGPFDYDQENLTNMLWVSEGLSVYYQDLILVRAGLMTREQYLTKMGGAIAAFENATGHYYQSATESSQNTWNSGSGVGGDRTTTISYYNNGAMLGAMLDLKIRESSENRKSLDDVMRAMYQKYYLEKKRGFTDAEFRAECDSAAGTSLGEIFAYASTSKEVDYARYFAMAGLKLAMDAADAPGGFIGLYTRNQEIPPSDMPAGGGRGGGGRGGGRAGAGPPLRLIVTDVAANSPAAKAGLAAGDWIVDVDGAAATARVLNDAINSKSPGATIRLRVTRAGTDVDAAIEVAANVKKAYRLEPAPQATSAQNRIFTAWLRSEP